MKKIALTMMSLLLLSTFTTVNAETNTVITPRSSTIKTTQDNNCPHGNNPQHCYFKQSNNRISQKRNKDCSNGNIPQKQRKQDGHGPHHQKQHDPNNNQHRRHRLQ